MTEPVPGPPSSNRTPILVAIVAVVAAVVIAAIVVATSGDDDPAVAREGISSSSTVATDGGGADGSGGSTSSGSTGSSVDPEHAPTIQVTGTNLPSGADQGTDDPAIGKKLPGIAGSGYDGKRVALNGTGARLIVVMAHWCPHCQREIPQIVKWRADGAVPDDVELLGLSTAVAEQQGNYPPASWLEREGFDAPVLADDEKATGMQALGAEGFPTFVAVGADGRVAARASGEIGRDQFEALVKAAQKGAAR